VASILQILILGLVWGVIVSPLVVSFSVICGTTRVFHFPHATLCLLSAYVAWWTHGAGLSLPLALLVGLVTAMLLGGLLSVVLYLPLIKQKASDIGLLMAALGLFLVIEHVIALLFSPSPHVFLDSTATVLRLGLIRLTSVQIVLSCLSLASVGLFWLFLRLSTVGRYLRAFASNPELARAIGVSDRSVVLWSLGLGTLIGSVTMLSQVAYSGILSPEMSLNAAIAAAACSVLFGVHRPFYGILASILLGVGQALSGLLFGAQWEASFALLLLVAGLALRRRAPGTV